MTARTLCAAVVASIALLGCAAGPPDKGSGIVASRCEVSTCPIFVSVVGNPPQVKVSEERLEVPSTNPGAEIIWLVQTRGYEFREGSIRFKGATVATCNANFVSHSHRQRAYNVTDVNRDRVECRYEITVYDSAGRPVALDPVIVNN